MNASVLIALLAASSAPTPLYALYQDQWQLSALTVTVVFSAYALALLVALLTTGALSDHVGRRPVLMGALTLQIVSMGVFVTAHGVGTLITARVLQGLATGTATSAAGAALLDLENPARPGRSALANSVSPVAGMAAGVMGATLLVHFAPGPTVTVYVLLMVLFAVQIFALAFTDETAHPHAGALRSMRPHLALPGAARRALVLTGAGVVAVWALGGFYSSLGPAFTRLISPAAPQAAGGLVFFTLTLCAALTVWATRSLRALTAATLGCCAVIPAVLLSVGAMHVTSLAPLFAGAALAGFGFGAVSQGALRMVLAPVRENERSGTLASYYVLSYLAMSLPAIGAGVLTVRYGLGTAAHLYAAAVILLALAAVGALARTLRDRSGKTTPAPLPPTRSSGRTAPAIARRPLTHHK